MSDNSHNYEFSTWPPPPDPLRTCEHGTVPQRPEANVSAMLARIRRVLPSHGTHAEDAINAFEELQATLSTRPEAQRSEHLLRELLAVIHCDGGHYVDAHGIEKAAADAIAIVPNRVLAVDAVRAFVKAEDDWRQQKGGMSEGTFDDPLADAYKQAKEAIATIDQHAMNPET